MKSTRHWEVLADFLSGWFPGLVAFVMVPFSVYLPNQADFGYDLMYVAPFLALFFAWGLFLVPTLFLGSWWRTRICMGLFYVGIYLTCSDILAPLQLGSLLNGPEHVFPESSTLHFIVDIGLIPVIFIAAIKLPVGDVRNWAARFVVLLVVVQAAYVWHGLAPQSFSTGSERKKQAATSVIKPVPSRGNVYQFCFDAYSGLAFLKALEIMGREADFDGFTFFKNNRSNYLFTLESMASYFTGTLFRGGNARLWEEKRSRSGLIKHLSEAGYTVSMYTPLSSFFHEAADHKLSVRELAIEREASEHKFDCYDFADLWLVRLLPCFLEDQVYVGGQGLFRRIFSQRVTTKDDKDQCIKDGRGDGMNCVVLAKRFISDESQRPDHGQYVYLHTMVTHSPWGHRRPDCRLSSSSNGTYLDHALCATKLMVAVITKLKELGRYENSTIIFHSDHGAQPMSPQDKEGDIPPDIAKTLKATLGLSSRVFNSRSFALLLVKPAGKAGQPLEISESPTQLVDIPATLYAILGLPIRTDTGRNVFSVKASERREIPIFAGLVSLGTRGNYVVAGQQVFEGDLCRLGYTKGKPWKLYPTVHWRWK